MPLDVASIAMAAFAAAAESRVKRAIKTVKAALKKFLLALSSISVLEVDGVEKGTANACCISDAAGGAQGGEVFRVAAIIVLICLIWLKFLGYSGMGSGRLRIGPEVFLQDLCACVYVFQPSGIKRLSARGAGALSAALTICGSRLPLLENERNQRVVQKRRRRIPAPEASMGDGGLRLRFQSGEVKNGLRSNGAFKKTFCGLLNGLILPREPPFIVAAGLDNIYNRRQDGQSIGFRARGDKIMKIAPVADIKANFSEFLRKSQKGPISLWIKSSQVF